MAKAHAQWNVLGHGPIVKLASNLWWVSGDVPGMTLKRTMTIAKLRDERLVIYNGIALQEPAMQELERWGTPAVLIVPSGFHRLDAPAYKQRYPQLQVLAPKGARAKVQEVIAADGSFEDFRGDESVRLQTLRGMKEREGVMIVRSEDGTSVVFNDVMMNMDKKQDLMGYLFTTVMGSAPGPRVSRLSKLALVDDKKTLRADFEALAAIPDLVRVIVAHEKVAQGADARAALLQAASYL